MIRKIYNEPDSNEFSEIGLRPKKNVQDLNTLMSVIFQSVEKEGDDALIKFTSKYDGVDLNSLIVRPQEIENADRSIPIALKNAMQVAMDNITKFHKLQIVNDVEVETITGVICKQKAIGIEKVGIYIPGGTAPLFSTVLMLAIPATLAGCRDIILCSPPGSSGNIDPAILYAANLCGVKKIFKIGGAQAIAAMTIGTESIPSVHKIFGPGNQYVTAAKQFAAKYGVGMDSPAGPSELLVYANKTSQPEFVAADLLSQAEHGEDSQVILVSDSMELVNKVNEEIALQIATLPRKAIAEIALENSKALVFENSDKAFEFINTYGPEHLILSIDYYDEFLDKISNAGSVFLGPYCPESAGDYASGTNHTLPTDGWVKSCSGTNIDSFTKKITFQEISKTGLLNLGETIMEMAQHEGLDAHKRAVEIRLNQLKQ